ITIPHKIDVMEYLDEIDEMAIRIGAVNTILNSQGILKGFNSDWTGAMSALTKKTAIAGKKILIIGAGGAARAIGFGVVSKGGKLTIANRTHKKGEKLAADLGGEFIPAAEYSKSRWDIMINTTSVGMAPNTAAMPLESTFLEKNMVVMDIVYNPMDTCLLMEARKKDCTTIDGVAMFVCQGAWQFELWTGQKAPLDIMDRAVREALRKTLPVRH
ncbi:MAG: shikimate dehydrogenase, partial [Deltaproteobacteria bacterium]|nr:shikimate dehydrogenase [Deltaproteobacteria bacterium]